MRTPPRARPPKTNIVYPKRVERDCEGVALVRVSDRGGRGERSPRARPDGDEDRQPDCFLGCVCVRKQKGVVSLIYQHTISGRTQAALTHQGCRWQG